MEKLASMEKKAWWKYLRNIVSCDPNWTSCLYKVSYQEY